MLAIVLSLALTGQVIVVSTAKSTPAPLRSAACDCDECRCIGCECGAADETPRKLRTNAAGYIDCPGCKGEGYFQAYGDPDDGASAYDAECPQCNGYGRVKKTTGAAASLPQSRSASGVGGIETPQPVAAAPVYQVQCQNGQCPVPRSRAAAPVTYQQRAARPAAKGFRLFGRWRRQ